MIRSETNEKMDLEAPFHNESQTKVHFLQGQISAVPEIRADLFLALSKTGMCLLTILFF